MKHTMDSAAFNKLKLKFVDIDMGTLTNIDDLKFKAAEIGGGRVLQISLWNNEMSTETSILDNVEIIECGGIYRYAFGKARAWFPYMPKPSPKPPQEPESPAQETKVAVEEKIEEEEVASEPEMKVDAPSEAEKEEVLREEMFSSKENAPDMSAPIEEPEKTEAEKTFEKINAKVDHHVSDKKQEDAAVSTQRHLENFNRMMKAGRVEKKKEKEKKNNSSPGLPINWHFNVNKK